MDLSTGAVSRAILQKAGPTLQTMCTTMVDNGLNLDKGNTVLTNACGGLRCKKILHVHIPSHVVATQSSINIDDFIEKVVADCLLKAETNGYHSISFPVLGIGGGGYSVEKVGEPMLRAFKTFGSSSHKSVKTIRVVIVDDKSYNTFNQLFCAYFNVYPKKQSSHGFLPALKASLGLEQDTDSVVVDLSPEARTSAISSPRYHAVRQFRGIQNAVVVFRIFAATSVVAERIESEIRRCLKDHIREEVVDYEQCGSLLESDLVEMSEKLSDLDVHLTPLRKSKQIKIVGERTNVANAKALIMNIMREIDQAAAQLIIYQWATSSDGGMEVYPHEAAIQLERAHKKGVDQVELVIDGIEVIINLKAMKETSRITGQKVDVIREKKTPEVGQ